jgi:hypothetical protein
MSKKIILLTLFLTTTVFISGCIIDKENNANKTETVKSDIIPTVNLPSGFTFMAIHETDEKIGNTSIEAIEGIYRTDTDKDEIYIQVFNTEMPDTLFGEYKSQPEYKDVNYNPFTEITINGHKATQVTYYNWENTPKYNIIWTTKNSMIKVGPSFDLQKAISLATATNS